ncbi:hypothetical protein Tco_1530234 [Tanacetum coccineum]
MGGSYYPIPCSIISTGKDRKTPQRYPDVPTTSWRIFILSMDSFQGLTPKSPSSWHRPLASSPKFFMDMSITNDPRDLAKPVKAIALPQDVPINKITTLCEICSGPYDTQYCMEDPEQAFVEYASSCTDETGEDDGEVMFIEIIRDDNEPLNEGEGTTTEGPMIMRRKLNPKEDANGGIGNFTGRIKGMYVFIGNFTYVVDFMIVEDISSIIDPGLSQAVLGRPFIESNMAHDLPEGVVRFTNRDDEVTYKIPHNIEQYNLLSNLEKEHTKSFYLVNEEDKKRGVDYVMSKILRFYKECLELGPEYVTGLEDE